MKTAYGVKIECEIDATYTGGTSSLDITFQTVIESTHAHLCYEQAINRLLLNIPNGKIVKVNALSVKESM